MHSYQVVVCGPCESKTTLNPSSQSILVGSHLHLNEGHHIDGLVRDCSNSSAIAMELLQSSPNPSI